MLGRHSVKLISRWHTQGHSSCVNGIQVLLIGDCHGTKKCYICRLFKQSFNWKESLNWRGKFILNTFGWMGHLDRLSLLWTAWWAFRCSCSVTAIAWVPSLEARSSRWIFSWALKCDSLHSASEEVWHTNWFLTKLLCWRPTHLYFCTNTASRVSHLYGILHLWRLKLEFTLNSWVGVEFR